MTLLEITIAITILVMGVVGSMQALVLLERSQERTREVGRGTQAARQVLEKIQAEAFAEAFRRYNGATSDDPGGAGTAPGKNFAVPGLSARAGDPDGMPGEVIFPTPPGLPTVLRENIVDSKVGMPRDLNGDGIIDGVTNCATTYKILPVRVIVRWTGAAGPGEVELRTMLGNY
jgi:type II secretory pathway pseudopilin PulG